MKTLNQTQVLAILNNEVKPSIFDEHFDAVKHEERLRFHSETRLDLVKYRNRALDRFLIDLPKTLLPDEKYQMFVNLITSPLPTVEVTDSAYNELYKLFFGQNRVVAFRFTEDHEDLSHDWEMYRKLNGFNDWFRLEGWDVFKNHINAPLVIDLPPLVVDEEGRMSMKSDKPEPFFFFVPTESVIDLYNDHNNKCHYLLYQKEAPKHLKEEQDIDRIAYYVDSERYATFIRKQDNWIFAAESPHDLGYTPAQSFWNKPLRNSTYQRQNPITSNLGALDWMLYTIISKRNLDLYAGFPILSVYEQQCDYKNEAGFECHGGRVEFYTDPSRGSTAYGDCPKCKNNQLIGAGSTIVLPLPDPDSDSNINLMPAVNVTHGDVKSLAQMNQEIDRQKSTFMVQVTGFDNQENNALQPSKNDSQMTAHMESRHSVIMELKEGFEQIEKFVLDTSARLRYGDSYIGSTVNYGSRFFLKSLEEMQKDYEQAKTNGMPAFELSNMRKEIYSKKYAADPKILSRILMLSQLEPYPDYTVQQLQSVLLYIDSEELALKIAFNDLVARFERENGPIDMYLRGLSVEMRVDLIKAQLKEYLSKMDIPYEESQNEVENGDTSKRAVPQQSVRQK